MPDVLLSIAPFPLISHLKKCEGWSKDGMGEEKKKKGMQKDEKAGDVHG